MKEVEVYYLRGILMTENGVTENVPYATVAVKWNGDGTVTRGVSICSTKDKFVKVEGRKRAIARMNAAEKAKRDLFIMNKYQGVKEKKLMPDVVFDRLGFYRAKPTKMEHRMFVIPAEV